MMQKVFSDTPILTINMGALKRNYQQLCQNSGSAETATVVKANAYGLGMARIAPALAQAGCRKFFVAAPSEALALRDILRDESPDAAIYVLNGLADKAAADYVAHHLTPCFISLEQMQQWQAHCQKTSAAQAAAIFIDTGFNRLGLSPETLLDIAASPKIFEGWKLNLIISHLACADNPAHPQNKAQLEQFRHALENLPPAPASLANSGGIALGGDFHFQLTRPGIALYGGAATGNPEHALQPVATLEAPILQIRQLYTGDTVGYGASFAAPHDMQIALISLGYGDGLLRQFGMHPAGTVRLAIGGQAAPIIGRVSMDSLAVDISNLPRPPAIGAMVQIFGADNPIDQLAAQSGTLSYELLTGLNNMVGNRYKTIYT